MDATIEIAQPDLRNLSVTGSAALHLIQIDGVATTAKDLARAYTSGTPAQRADLLGKISSATRADVDADLAADFPGAARNVADPVVDTATLQDSPSRGTYDPVNLTVTASVTRSSQQAGLGDLPDAGIGAVFAAGASVRSQFALTTQPGYDTVYVLHPPASPAGLSFEAPAFTDAQGSFIDASGPALRILVPNALNSTVKTPVLGLTVRDPSASAPAAERIDTAIDVVLGGFEKGQTSLPLNTTVTASIHAVDVAKRFPNALPSNVELAYVSADGLRALRQAGVLTDAQLANAQVDLMASVQSSLGASLGSGMTLTGGFEPSDLAAAPATPYGTDPAVRYVAHAASAYPIPGDHAADADLALKIGATLAFDLSLQASADHANDYTIHAPAGVVFTSVTGAGGALSAEGKAATFHLAAGGAAQTAHLELRKADAPSYSAQKADLGVLVDLKDLDVTIGKAVKGDFGNLAVDVTVTGKMSVVQVPADLKASLGEHVKLDYLDGNALRLLKARGLLSDQNVSDLQAKLLDQVATNLQSALGEKVDVTGGFDAESLSSSASADAPVLFAAHASFTKPLAGGSSNAAAIALYTVHQSFTFPKVQGLDTTYTVVMPKGLAVADVQVTGGNSTKGSAPDGRDQFQVTPSAGSAQATVAIAVTPTLVVMKFWPALLLAVLVLVLLVGTPIAIVATRRRKAK